MGSAQPDQPPFVLVVDDEPQVRALLAQILRPRYRVLTARDGQEALDLVWGMGSDIRVVVTDIQMPRLDGIELAVQLRSLDRPPHVLFISGSIGTAEPPGPYLSKPFMPDVLLHAVSQLAARAP